jgi:hypothetical protein
MLVYSNSCSFGISKHFPTYANFVANKMNADLVNKGRDGSCNRRIIRTTLRDVLELQSQHNNIVVLIGLSFIFRTELWQDWESAIDNDGHFRSIEIKNKKISYKKGFFESLVPDIHEYVDPQIKEYYKNWLALYNPESEVTNLLTDLIMLTGWLEKK